MDVLTAILVVALAVLVVLQERPPVLRPGGLPRRTTP